MKEKEIKNKSPDKKQEDEEKEDREFKFFKQLMEHDSYVKKNGKVKQVRWGR